MASRWRRVYRPGLRCKDCGHVRSTTVVIFWVNAMRYRLCAQCVRLYRPVILRNHEEQEHG